MKCPFCQFPNTKVIDSRESHTGDEIRRRRECDTQDGGCGSRFTTFERVELRLPLVIKRDGSRASFDREKVRHSILTAVKKRSIGDKEIETFLRALEKSLAEQARREVSTKSIGHEVMLFLKERDPVAYVRFASVYMDFRSTAEFSQLIESMSGAQE